MDPIVSDMTDDRKAGLALIAGTAGFLLTMAMHPTTTLQSTPAQVESMAIASGHAHGLAMLSIVALVLGACGLTRRMADTERLALTGLVFFAFACVAIFVATAVSGFIEPRLMWRMLRDTPDGLPIWHVVIAAVFQFNQVFACLYTVAASLAIALWGVSALRHGGLGRGIAIYGCVIAPVVILGVLVGHLHVDVHGMAAIVLAQGIWFAGAGWSLYRAEPEVLTTA